MRTMFRVKAFTIKVNVHYLPLTCDPVYVYIYGIGVVILMVSNIGELLRLYIHITP